MMTRAFVVAGILLSVTIGVGAAWAEDAAPASSNKPAMSSKMSAADKKAISKSCSDQANAKGLHGEPRRKFRSACKKAGGKVE